MADFKSLKELEIFPSQDGSGRSSIAQYLSSDIASYRRIATVLTCPRAQKSITLTFDRNSNKLHFYVLINIVVMLPNCLSRFALSRHKNVQEQKARKKEDFSYLDNRIIIVRKKCRRKRSSRIPRKT